MSTVRRYAPANMPAHVIVRGHNKMAVFGGAEECEFYLLFLQHAASRTAVAVHAFAVMTTHAHLIVTPTTDDGLGRMMQRVGTRYARYFNRKHGRLGAVWAGRYRAQVIDTPRYFLSCLRYIERNPVEAGLVERPDEYRWSTYLAHAFGAWPEWVTPHPTFLDLGATGAERHEAYRAICGEKLPDEEVAWIRYVVDHEWPHGTLALPRDSKPYSPNGGGS